jgi:hypothetical protein
MNADMMFQVFEREYFRLTRWLRQYMTSEHARYVAALAFTSMLTYADNRIPTPYGPYQQLYYEAHRLATRRGRVFGFYMPIGWQLSVQSPDELELGQFVQTYLNYSWANKLADLTANQRMDVSQLIVMAQDWPFPKIDIQQTLAADVGVLRTLARLVASLDHKEKALATLRREMDALSVHELQKSLLWLERQRKRSVGLRNVRAEQADYPSKSRSKS